MPPAAQTSTAGMMSGVFLHSRGPVKSLRMPPSSTLRPNERTGISKLAGFFKGNKKFFCPAGRAVLVGVNIKLDSLSNTDQKAEDGTAKLDRAEVFFGD